MTYQKILQVHNLVATLNTQRGLLKAVDNICFNVFKGRTLGIVGESGCGKSMTALSIMRLIAADQGSIQGEVLLDGTNIFNLQEEDMRKVRGNRIAMIFQEPMTSMNPVLTIGYQIAEVLMLHKNMHKAQAHARSVELLDLVGISNPQQRATAYPHQLSGGMQQRVMIAMALACDPDVIIADEPTTALDVTIQAQILELLAKLQKEKGMAIIFITHNLGVVAEICHQVAVMYAGKIVEYTSVESLFATPMHPYTKGLLQSIPSFTASKQEALFTIKGMVPSAFNLPKGCSFQRRCEYATAKCKTPVHLEEKAKDHHVACFHPLNRRKPVKQK